MLLFCFFLSGLHLRCVCKFTVPRHSAEMRGILKILESAENYLETILMLSKVKDNVRSIDIANELEFSKPSVSVAMKNLRNNGYIEMDANGYITLLPAGLAIAEKIYERHTLISNWLIALGVTPETAVKDACRIEHVISAESFEAMKQHALKGQKQ